MQYIFYDFETSTREYLGQILTYAFITTDENLITKHDCCGSIKVKPTELPDIDAILVNNVNIDTLAQEGDTEYEAALKIHNYLTQTLNQGPTTLIGYNSNQFDLNFLRNTLLRYGIDPYFKGKLKNLDLLHYCQHLAFNHPEKWPWKLTNSNTHTYYSFKLEDVTQGFNLIDTAQTHNAKDDVLLTIKLAQTLSQTFTPSLQDFRPISLPHSPTSQLHYEIATQKVRDFATKNTPLSAVPSDIASAKSEALAKEEPPQHFKTTALLKLQSIKNGLLMIQLDTLEELLNTTPTPTDDDLLRCIRYKNFNKDFLVLDPVSQEDYLRLEPIAQKASTFPFFNSLTPNSYFKLIEKNWDIEYQIHKLGFTNIPKLHHITQKLIKTPESYGPQLLELLNSRQQKEDDYLIRLYNRNYLNTSPNPDTEQVQKYLVPRYVTGTLLRNENDFESLESRLERMTSLLEHNTLPPDQTNTISALYAHYHCTLTKHQIDLIENYPQPLLREKEDITEPTHKAQPTLTKTKENNQESEIKPIQTSLFG